MASAVKFRSHFISRLKSTSRCISSASGSGEYHQGVQIREQIPAKKVYDPSKVLSNFADAKAHFKSLIMSSGVKEYKQTYHAKPVVAEIFRDLFPHLVEERGILESPDTNHVNQLYHRNKITIREGQLPAWQSGDQVVDFLAVGGPTAVGAAALAKAGGIDKVTHTWYTRRGSNMDGSAYYYHIRDAFPVYVKPVNRGPYCVYTDLAKRLRTHASLERWSRDDPDYVKIHLNWVNILKDPSVIWKIFAPNVLKMLWNLYICEPEKSDISQVAKHAARSREIAAAVSQTLGLPKLIYHGYPEFKAFFGGLTDDEDIEHHFQWLSRFAPKDIHFKDVSSMDHGLGVNQLLLFPEDGLVSPHACEDMLSTVESRQLEKIEEIVVSPSQGVYAQFRMPDGSERRVFSDRCVAALGPSAQMVDGKGREIGVKSMWAAGSSSVVLIVVPLPDAEEARAKILNKCERFEFFLDSTNQHWTPIEKTEFIDAEGRSNLAFAMQMTGGGNFPSRYTRNDTAYNLIHNFERIFCHDKKNEGEFFYDLIQLRSCPRAVSADNTIKFRKVGDRLTVAYAQGGIGMTTLFANAELALRLAGVQRPVDIYKSDPLEGLSYSSMIDN